MRLEAGIFRDQTPETVSADVELLVLTCRAPLPPRKSCLESRHSPRAKATSTWRLQRSRTGYHPPCSMIALHDVPAISERCGRIWRLLVSCVSQSPNPSHRVAFGRSAKLVETLAHGGPISGATRSNISLGYRDNRACRTGRRSSLPRSQNHASGKAAVSSLMTHGALAPRQRRAVRQHP